MAYPSRIMIVEDNVLLLLDLADSLADRGMEALAFTTADAAAAALDTGDIDALITDIELPGALDGLQLARLCAMRRPGLPIVVVSGGVRPTVAELPPGAVFMQKPYHVDQVLKAVEPRQRVRRAA
jgi:DNA-binding NtrC family response regulator